MNKTKIIICIVFALLCILFPVNSFAEDLLPSGVIPKLPKTVDDPKLSNGNVYPFWGPICQRYTYSVVYQDEKNRPPEYIKMYFNGKMIDLEKEDSQAKDYKKGVKYIFQNVPNKFGSNFYYFEASNGAGKTRASIIDSPDNGPVLFDADFKHNEIVLINPATGKEVWRYPTNEEWIGAVSLSNDGKYLATQTSNHIYLFNTETSKPLWNYESASIQNIGGDVKGGVAISGDGSKIFGALNGKALMFDKSSNKPIWTYNLDQNGGGAYGVDISKNGQNMAVAMAGSESDENTNVLLLFDSNGKKLWQYHASGNWHEVNFSADGKYLAGATGCPDRRGYIFSIGSDTPIIKSDPLSKESPIDEARISSDGSLIAYGVESGYGAIILMDKNSQQIVWEYKTPQGTSVRALSITPNGNNIGAGTFGGDILIFDKNSNKPTQQLKINSTIGAFDIADDGSFFATGSADKKIRIFEKGENKSKAEIELQEYIGEIDISGNGKYLAGGTSGSVYFFETLIDLNDATISACKEIIEPPKNNMSSQSKESIKDDTKNGTDNKGIYSFILFSLPATISSVIAIAILILLITYIGYCYIKKIPLKKILIRIALFLVAISLVATYYFWKTQVKKSGDATSAPTNSTVEDLPSKNLDDVKTGVCGNGLCEPDLGESQPTCPRDCSTEN